MSGCSFANLDDWLVDDTTALSPLNEEDPQYGPGPLNLPAPDQAAPQYGPQGMEQDPNGQPDMGGGEEDEQPELPDVNDDPDTPDMPDGASRPQDQDFEVWKREFAKQTVKGDAGELLELVERVRERPDLSHSQRKFVEDNHAVQILRHDGHIAEACAEYRRAVRKQLDRNNPATTVVAHLAAAMERRPPICESAIKLAGYESLKHDLWRKLFTALVGGIQVSTGAGTNEDVIINERDYSILVSTRFAAQWGNLHLAPWTMLQDDPTRFLTEPELRRLEDGSPDEREALRQRIVIESIADRLETRAFIAITVGDNGTIELLGWDIANGLRNAFRQGKLIVRGRRSDNSEAYIDDEGKVVPRVDYKILFARATGETDPDAPDENHEDFIESRNGSLFCVASPQVLAEAATSLQGMALRKIPYNGNPSDIARIRRAVFSPADLILRRA